MAGHALKGQELVLRIWESTAGVIAKEVDSGRSSALMRKIVALTASSSLPKVGCI